MTITTIAGKKLKEVLARTENNGKYIRLYVAGFG
jgi:hypothetical protein